MILSYSNPKFKGLILSGQKIHTIRQDVHDRWKVGMSIQHWMYNPRNVAKGPHKFLDGTCAGIQYIHMVRQGDYTPKVFVRSSPVRFGTGRVWLTQSQVHELADNDGLTISEFIEWFLPNGAPDYYGKIIHFTNFMYTERL